jgi:transcriptional regulator GlxA family with amidase domain
MPPPTSGPQAKPLDILIPIYPDFNTFDLNGPIEVLSQANRNSGSTHFKISIAAATELTTSIEGVRIARDISLADAIERVSEWDILLVPGGVEKTILTMIASWKEKEKTQPAKAPGSNEIMRLLNLYMERLDGFVFTVCTGSLFLGALGKLIGRRATTHWGSLGTLKRLCAEHTDGITTKRFSMQHFRY